MVAAGSGGGGRGHRVDIGALLAQALAHQRDGELGLADRLCRRILSLDPDDVGALHLAGMIAAETGRYAEAVEVLDRAIALEGEVPAFHYTLSRALELAGRTAESLLNRGNGLRAEGRLAEAGDCYWQALALEPDLPGAYAHLGDLSLAEGDAAAALSFYRQALVRRSGYALAELGVGNALAALAQPGEAIASYQRVLVLDPGNTEAMVRLGGLHHRLGDHDEAIVWYDRALAVRPALAAAHHGLGLVLAGRGLAGAAAQRFRAALAHRPRWAEGYVRLGIALRDQGAAAEARAAFQRALDLDPESAVAHSWLLVALALDDGASPAERTAEAGRFQAVQAARFDQPAPEHRNHRDPERRLRIGYVSPDFRRGAMAAFLEPLLAHHDRAQVETVCYADCPRPDVMTSRFKEMADRWVDTVGLEDAELAARIAADGVDILVDLAGHRPGNRLPVFVRQPAPVQVSWLGCGEATGLAAIGWRLSDAVIDPAGAAEPRTAERPVRLPRGGRCWQPPREAPAVVPAAAGPVTFGCLAGLAGLSPSAVAAWAEVLGRVPAAQLLLAGRALGDPLVAAAVRTRFARHGIAPERLTVLGAPAGPAARLALYGRIDVALDPFPVSAPAALAEALWMGVPVVTLAADRPAGRIGASLLNQAGLERLVAQDVDGYVTLAATLAVEPRRRAVLRSGLRSHLAKTAVCDGAGFARAVEAVYRTLWRHWCR